MVKTVIGVFREKDDAEDAINELQQNDYNPEDISIVMRRGDEKKIESFKDTGANVTGGAISGATTGGILGGIAGLLIATGIFPGLGTVLIGGPLAAFLGLTGAAATALSGATTGALAGGLIGGLMGLGLKRDEAEIYENQIKEGAILIAVPTKAEETNFVEELMQDYGGINVKTLSTPVEDLAEEDYDARYYGRDNREEAFIPLGIKGGRRKTKRPLMDQEERPMKRSGRFKRSVR